MSRYELEIRCTLEVRVGSLGISEIRSFYRREMLLRGFCC